MDWTNIINALIKVVVMVIMGVITTYVIPFLKQKQNELKIKAENEGWASILASIDKFVAAAEQLAINSGYDNAWKKSYVINMVQKLTGSQVDDELNAYIESSVILLHNELYGEVE